MTKLLISVRNVEEARMLPVGQIGIIDVKEPRRGPLGSADLKTISRVHQAFEMSTPISAALGELVDCEPERLKRLPPIQFAKFGLSRMRAVGNWKSRWLNCISQLPEATQPVAVIYADWRTCGAPSPDEVVSAAIEGSCRAILIDTFEKTKGSLFDWLTLDELQRITQRVRTTKAIWVLAGGLRSRIELQKSLRLGPDLIGVRGAVCNDDRASGISSARLAEFLRQFSHLAESYRVIESRSIESESVGSESRNEGITL